MATTKGPAFGFEAAGSIQRTMVFSNWKGRSTVKFSAQVTNPNTAPQVARRAMMRFLSTAFGTLSAANIATWASLSIQRNISAYNAWLGYNMDRWTRYLPPTKAFPAAESEDAQEIQNPSATALKRSIVLDLDSAEALQGWGIVIHRSTTPAFTPAIDNVIRTSYWDGNVASDFTWKDGPLTPDTYYYRFWTFSIDGKSDKSMTTQVNATIS